VKKLISIGVALALLAMAVVPAAVAAADVVPTTYAKIPFAIVQSGFYMLGCLMGDVADVLSAAGYGTVAGIDLTKLLPAASPIFNTLGGFVGTPLGWSVDMMAWGVKMVGCIVDVIAGPLGLPSYIGDIIGCIKDALGECYPAQQVCNGVSNTYHPC
jgi:hypothetical protein